jgi:hypothetical protein
MLWSLLKCSYKLWFCLLIGFHALRSLGLSRPEAQESLWNSVLFARQVANYKSTIKARDLTWDNIAIFERQVAKLEMLKISIMQLLYARWWR